MYLHVGFLTLNAIKNFHVENIPLNSFRCTGEYPNGFPREQVNKISSYIDANDVYGSTETRAKLLRTMKDGKMKMGDDGLIPVNILC